MSRERVKCLVTLKSMLLSYLATATGIMSIDVLCLCYYLEDVSDGVSPRNNRIVNESMYCRTLYCTIIDNSVAACTYVSDVALVVLECIQSAVLVSLLE